MRVRTLLIHLGVAVGTLMALPAVKADTVCGRAKLRALGQFSSCRVGAWRRADRSGTSPDARLLSCDSQFVTRWQSLDGGSDCLTTGDAETTRDEVASCIDAVAGRLIVSPKVIFTTAGLWHGGSPGPGEFTYVSGADARCQETASTVPALQGKSWKAWLSGADPDVAAGALLSARERTTHSAGPYVRTDGVLVAVSFAGLTSGALLAPLDKDENGGALPDAYGVWTGTEIDGTAAQADERCRVGSFDWNTSGVGVAGRLGNPAASDASWTNWKVDGCQFSFHLYCIEQ